IDRPDHRYKLLRVERASGLRVLRTQMPPGFRYPRHRHSGSVIAFTVRGVWGYEEYGSWYDTGSLIFEPAGSVHTLVTPATNDGMADVVFVSHGANINLDDEGDVVSVSDSLMRLQQFYEECDRANMPRPTHIE